MILRFASAQSALDASKVDLERRLEALNQLRQDVEKDRSQFVKQEVYDTKTAYYDAWCRGADKKFSYWGGGLAVLIFVLQFLFRCLK